MSRPSNSSSSRTAADRSPPGAIEAGAIEADASEVEPGVSALLARVAACTHCAEHLPHPPRPVFRVSASARLLIVGQAPGRRVHETGIPWNDPSGDTLRDWLGMTRDDFYDVARIAIVPTGLCYPGTAKGGDLAPRPECAPLWHGPLRAVMPDIALTLLVGAHAQAYYLGAQRGRTLADTVAAGERTPDGLFPLPHPSPRNRLWFKRHPWFAERVIPVLRERVGAVLASGDNGAISR